MRLRLSAPQAAALRVYLLDPRALPAQVRSNTRASLLDHGLLERDPKDRGLFTLTDAGHRVLAEHDTRIRLRERSFGGWDVHLGRDGDKLGWVVYSREAGGGTGRWIAYVRREDKPLRGEPVGYDKTLLGICMFFEREGAPR